MVEKSAMTKKSIFEMLEGFSKYYDVMSPEDKKALLQAMVSFIELYPEKRDDKHLIKTIHFTFPVTYDGESGALFVRTNKQQVETVTVLSRKSASKSFIPVSISPKDMGLSEEKDQPTYANIRDYVQKTHGMKVSSLYVAQMKAECGLGTQADRSGDKKQPKCPPEKREAILDAFRHFGLIGEDETEK